MKMAGWLNKYLFLLDLSNRSSRHTGVVFMLHSSTHHNTHSRHHPRHRHRTADPFAPNSCPKGQSPLYGHSVNPQSQPMHPSRAAISSISTLATQHNPIVRHPQVHHALQLHPHRLLAWSWFARNLSSSSKTYPCSSSVAATAIRRSDPYEMRAGRLATTAASTTRCRT